MLIILDLVGPEYYLKQSTLGGHSYKLNANYYRTTRIFRPTCSLIPRALFVCAYFRQGLDQNTFIGPTMRVCA